MWRVAILICVRNINISIHECVFSLTLAGGPAQRLASILVLLSLVPCFHESTPGGVVCFEIAACNDSL